MTSLARLLIAGALIAAATLLITQPASADAIAVPEGDRLAAPVGHLDDSRQAREAHVHPAR